MSERALNMCFRPENITYKSSTSFWKCDAYVTYRFMFRLYYFLSYQTIKDSNVAKKRRGEGMEKQLKVYKRGRQVTINCKDVKIKLTMFYLRSSFCSQLTLFFISIVFFGGSTGAYLQFSNFSRTLCLNNIPWS